LPVGLGVVLVAVVLPCVDFELQQSGQISPFPETTPKSNAVIREAGNPAVCLNFCRCCVQDTGPGFVGEVPAHILGLLGPRRAAIRLKGKAC
jgi:hypothetical protein